MLVTFICGCQTKQILTRENLKTMDMVELDSDGFIICALHHFRRKAWRSLPIIQMPKSQEVENPPYYAAWEFSSWTPLEIEAYIVFGEQPYHVELADVLSARMPLDFKNVRDRRDNRDPQSLAVAVSAIGVGSGVVLPSTKERQFFEATTGYRDPDKPVFRENRNGGSPLHKRRRLEIVYDADMQSRLRERP